MTNSVEEKATTDQVDITQLTEEDNAADCVLESEMQIKCNAFML